MGVSRNRGGGIALGLFALAFGIGLRLKFVGKFFVDFRREEEFDGELEFVQKRQLLAIGKVR